MSSRAYNDNDTLGAEEMVLNSTSLNQHGANTKQEDAILGSKSGDKSNSEDQDCELPTTKETNDKGGSCRCVIA